MTNNQQNHTSKYDSKTIIYHWLTALLVFGLYFLGENIDSFSTGTPRIFARSLHITFGLILAALLVKRLMWRFGSGTRLPHAVAGIQGQAAVWMHRALYALLISIVVIGIACVWIRGDNLFNLFTIPAFDPSNKALRHNAVELHGMLANVLLTAAALHGLTALYHHFIKKDGILKRMLK